MLKHQNIVISGHYNVSITFFSFRYRRMNPHVIVVYECVLARFADLIR